MTSTTATGIGPEYVGSGGGGTGGAAAKANLPRFPTNRRLVHNAEHEALLGEVLPALEKYGCLDSPVWKGKRSPWVKTFVHLYHESQPWAKFSNSPNIESKSKYSFKSYKLLKIYEELEQLYRQNQKNADDAPMSDIHKELYEKLKTFYTKGKYYNDYMTACKEIALGEVVKPASERAAIPNNRPDIESTTTNMNSSSNNSNNNNEMIASLPSREQQQKNKKQSSQNELWKKLNIGSRIAIYWKNDKCYYPCTVEGRQQHHPSSSPSSRFFVRYEDGESEWTDMAQEKLRWVDDEDDEDENNEDSDNDNDNEAVTTTIVTTMTGRTAHNNINSNNSSSATVTTPPSKKENKASRSTNNEKTTVETSAVRDNAVVTPSSNESQYNNFQERRWDNDSNNKNHHRQMEKDDDDDDTSSDGSSATTSYQNQTHQQTAVPTVFTTETNNNSNTTATTPTTNVSLAVEENNDSNDSMSTTVPLPPSLLSSSSSPAAVNDGIHSTSKIYQHQQEEMTTKAHYGSGSKQCINGTGQGLVVPLDKESKNTTPSNERLASVQKENALMKKRVNELEERLLNHRRMEQGQRIISDTLNNSNKNTIADLGEKSEEKVRIKAEKKDDDEDDGSFGMTMHSDGTNNVLLQQNNIASAIPPGTAVVINPTDRLNEDDTSPSFAAASTSTSMGGDDEDAVNDKNGKIQVPNKKRKNICNDVGDDICREQKKLKSSSLLVIEEATIVAAAAKGGGGPCSNSITLTTEDSIYKKRDKLEILLEKRHKRGWKDDEMCKKIESKINQLDNEMFELLNH